MANSTITLTFGECAENHTGMEKLGDQLRNGFTLSDLREIKAKFPSELVILDEKTDAGILVIRNGTDIIANINGNDLFNEMTSFQWDKKAKMRGRVVNKNARWNVCFGETYRPPNYEEGKGTIIKYTPLLQKLKNGIEKSFGEKAIGLQCEGNYYYDNTQCGIGYHGDTERHIVIGVRIGATIPLYFKEFNYGHVNVGKSPIVINLNNQDIYIMTQKATGFDWRKSSLPVTFRHAAGCRKYTMD